MQLDENHAFRRLFEDAGVALIAMDPEGRVRFWNAAARKLFAPDRRIDDANQAPIEFVALLPRERRDLARRLLARLLRSGESHEFEVADRRENGETIHLAVILSPVRDFENAIVGASAWIRDITKRVHLQHHLSQARKMASLGSLAAGVAHHYNNLLGGVTTTVDYAQSADDPDVARRALRQVAETLNRAARLSNSLLAFAEGDRRNDDRADLTETVYYFLDELERTLPDKHVEVRTEIERVPVIDVPGPTTLTVLRHLASNAIDAMPHGGALTVGLRKINSGEVAVTLTDDGAGISEADLERVFEPFFTTKGASSEVRTDHLGLGLAVVHGLVQDMGGRIVLSSAPGRGTTVQVVFRVRQPARRTPPLE